MWNVRLRALKLPIIYLPYMIWPVREDRAAGLLMPDFGSTLRQGNVVTLPVFVPLGRSADVTLVPRYYEKAGFMGGAEVRFIPNVKGSGFVGGSYIYDKVSARDRYRFDYGQTQEFRNGFRMVADVGLVSDSEYYSDFERDLNVASSPQSLARLEFSRNGPWFSMNVRELRREQLSTGLVQASYPEIELRGRSRRVGRTPLYFALESSIASLQQQGTTIRADYLRGDLAPELSLPFSPAAWFDVTPRVAYRWTGWTQRLAEGVVQEDSLTRQLWAYGVEVVGPKLYRIFGRAQGRPRYKHTIETQVTYGYADEFDRQDEVLSFDEIDGIGGAGNQVNYALVQRLFARRAQQVPAARVSPADAVVLPDGTTDRPAESSETPVEEQPEQPSVPVEIASLELRQRRSFDSDLSSADLDADGVVESFSPYSDVQLAGRFNPTRKVSLDLRGTWDILWDEVQDVSLSGTLRSPISSVRFSMFHRRGLGVNPSTLEPNDDSTQAQLSGQLSLVRDRLKLNLMTSYNADPIPGTSHFPELRWQTIYATQCCTFLVERLTREFTGAETRRELYFRVDLSGVGKVLSHTF
jgi:hypothetical protein